MDYSQKIDEIMQKMQRVLPHKRFVHSIGVGYFAASVAMAYGKNSEKAMLAGLLHDCAKCLSEKEILKQCMDNKIPVTELERQQPFLLHGKLGAWHAKHKYGIKDKKILNAIEFHINGKPAMCFLEKCIYLADYLELGRKHPTEPSLDALRQLAFQDLDLTVYYVAKNTVSYLEDGGMPDGVKMDLSSVATLNYYEQLLKERGTSI